MLQAWRKYPLFDNIFTLVGVPVITVQLRYDGWVTEMQDPQLAKQLGGGAKGLNNLLYRQATFREVTEVERRVGVGQRGFQYAASWSGYMPNRGQPAQARCWCSTVRAVWRSTFLCVLAVHLTMQ